jgi:hypothetical protein
MQLYDQTLSGLQRQGRHQRVNFKLRHYQTETLPDNFTLAGSPSPSARARPGGGCARCSSAFRFDPWQPDPPARLHLPRLPRGGHGQFVGLFSDPAAALPKRAFDRAAPRGVARSASRCQQLWCGDFDVGHVLFVAVRKASHGTGGFSTCAECCRIVKPGCECAS